MCNLFESEDSVLINSGVVKCYMALFIVNTQTSSANYISQTRQIILICCIKAVGT